MQTAGDLVALAAELAAGMQNGVNHRYGGNSHFGVDPHGDSASVVGHADHIALQYFGLDMVAVACQRLVYGVIHDLIHQMVQTARSGGADIHTGALADCLQSLQNLNLCFVIVALFYLFDVAHSISYSQDRFDQIRQNDI